MKHFTVTSVQPLATNILRLSFADGADFDVDLEPLIRMHPTLAPLADPGVFADAKVGEFGGSVIWAGRDDLQLAADNLRARAMEQSDGYSHELIWDWMARHELAVDKAAEALGLSRRMLDCYLSGEKAMPLNVALACLRD